MPVREIRSGVKDQLSSLGLYPVNIPKGIYNPYYEGYSNRGIWPAFHSMQWVLAGSVDRYWNSWLKAVDKAEDIFLQEGLKHLEEEDVAWGHDYHLMGLPRKLRRERPKAKIGFFLHIPFPPPSVFFTLPLAVQQAIISGLMGADLVGMHTKEYVENFIDVVREATGVVAKNNLLQWEDRAVGIGAFPLGIDAQELRATSQSVECTDEYLRFLQEYEGQIVILGVDREDYTKLIDTKFEYYRTLLRRNPELVGRVVFLQVAVPTRENIREYRELRQRIAQLVVEINQEFQRGRYVPIRYLRTSFDKIPLYALYRLARRMFVMPFTDGLNLVAKEFVAAKGGEDPGALILSRRAGAYQELQGCLGVDSQNEDEVVAALKTAITMTSAEGVQMMKRLYGQIEHNTSAFWRGNFHRRLNEVHAMNR